jgi:hypothetical protein
VPKITVKGNWRKFIIFTHPAAFLKMTRSRRMRWTEHMARICEMMNAYKIPVEKSETKRLIGRSSHRWKAHIKRDVRVGSNGVDSSGTGYKEAAVSCECTTVKLLVSIKSRR